jgi:RNA recognition motif-containing protein
MDWPTKQNASFKLFVTGIPRRARLLEIEKFFKSYASVKLCENKNMKMSSLDQQNRGFCFLSGDANAGSLLTQMREFKFHGRTLTVTYSKSGKDLFDFNRKLNKCRLILKRVPGHVCQNQITEFIELNFGPVAKIFPFLPNVPQRGGEPTKVKKYLTYSILMLKPSSANAMCSDGQITLPGGIAVEVERYRKKPVLDDVVSTNKPSTTPRVNQAQANDYSGRQRDVCHQIKPCQRGYHMVGQSGGNNSKLGHHLTGNLVFRVEMTLFTFRQARPNQM